METYLGGSVFRGGNSLPHSQGFWEMLLPLISRMIINHRFPEIVPVYMYYPNIIIKSASFLLKNILLWMVTFMIFLWIWEKSLVIFPFCLWQYKVSVWNVKKSTERGADLKSTDSETAATADLIMKVKVCFPFEISLGDYSVTFQRRAWRINRNKAFPWSFTP